MFFSRTNPEEQRKQRENARTNPEEQRKQRENARTNSEEQSKDRENARKTQSYYAVKLTFLERNRVSKLSNNFKLINLNDD